ncbi:HEAT repeat domain-containing protein [Acinetobacter tandoii]|uniref:HEAT repeat domain-containing protein n=1 Tax=Acinetobacter tandoii TaxID=202954 RepID=UPI0040462A04
MKNNSKVIYLSITAVVIAFIGLFIYSKKSDDVRLNQRAQPYKSSTNAFMANSGATGNAQNLLYKAAPKWAQSMMDINDNSAYSQENKIQKLVELLKQNETNPEALSAILITLTALNPIEAADEIIPYLKNPNPKVQSAALAVLNNASLLTKQEHELKHSLPQNEAVRRRIANAVNQLKADPNTTNEVKQALISTYTVANPSLKDIQVTNP